MTRGCGRSGVEDKLSPVRLSGRPAPRQPRRRTIVGIRVVVDKGQSVQVAVRKLKQKIQWEAIDDRVRRRRWGDEHFQKPGYVRRRQKFFAKV